MLPDWLFFLEYGQLPDDLEKPSSTNPSIDQSILFLPQVRKLLQKVITDDSLRYKRLIERWTCASKEDEDNVDNLSLSS